RSIFSSRRRHTNSLCDWSSDVCSADLGAPRRRHGGRRPRSARDAARGRDEIGRASRRERGEISGGAGSLKKKRRRKFNAHIYPNVVATMGYTDREGGMR